MSREEALTAVSAELGTEVTEESLAQTASALETAKTSLSMLGSVIEMAEGVIPAAEAQLAEGQAQLNALYAQLVQARTSLSEAEATLAAGKSRLNAINSELYGSREGLIEAASLIAENEAKLEERKAELSSSHEALADYEDMQEKLRRSHDRFVGMGLGSEEDDDETLLAAAQEKADTMYAEYSGKLWGLIAGVALLLIAAAGYIVFAAMLKKRIDRRCFIGAAAICVLALSSAIVGLATGDVGSSAVISAFAVAVFAALELPAMKKDLEARA